MSDSPRRGLGRWTPGEWLTLAGFVVTVLISIIGFSVEIADIQSQVRENINAISDVKQNALPEIRTAIGTSNAAMSTMQSRTQTLEDRTQNEEAELTSIEGQIRDEQASLSQVTLDLATIKAQLAYIVGQVPGDFSKHVGGSR